jgi:GWxTD domain-containing protein
MFTYTVAHMKQLYFTAMVLLFFPLFSQAQKGLDSDHKDWLDQVAPIITEVERDVFSKLETRDERTKFINMFWARRDPLPDTRENEFYKEYMERIRYADFQFGRGAVKRGSRTERGYFYLLLGPPLERQAYTTYSQVWPLEIWHYKGETRFGLPPYFYLMFFQRDGLGEFKLYSPGVDGPQTLVIPSMSNQTLTRQVAMQMLKDVSGEVASAALSFIPGDSRAGSSASMSSELMIASLRELPNKKYSDAYARTFSYYKDYVETDYSHNFLESFFLFKLFSQGGQPFLHWSIEPSRINLSQYQGSFYAEFMLVVNIQDLNGKPLYEMEEIIPISVKEGEAQSLARQLIAFQDLLPVPPGQYSLHFFLQNKTAKEFTSFETKLQVPDFSQAHLSDILLYQLKQDVNQSQRGQVKAFSFSGGQYVFNAQKTFHPDQDLGLFCQFRGIPVVDTRVEVNIINIDTGESAGRFSRDLREAITRDGLGLEIYPIPLKDILGGYYRVEVTLLDSNGNILADGKDNFVLSSLGWPALPRVLSKLHLPYPNAPHQFILASQLFAKNSYEEAASLLNAVLSEKDTPAARLLLGRTRFALEQYEEAVETVLPLYQASGDNDAGSDAGSDAGKILAASYAALEDWSSALVYLEWLLARSSEIGVLNQASECYIKLNLPDKAIPLLEKSLSLNPNQPAIKELLEKMRQTIKKS